MKKITSILFACFLLMLANNATAQGLNSVNHTPDPAFTGDNVTLNMQGWLPDPCWKVSNCFWNWSGNTVSVYVDFDYDPPTPYCIQILGQWDWYIHMGNLNAGNYNAYIYDADWGQFLGSYNFTVHSNCQAPTASQIFVSSLSCTSATLNCSMTGVDGYGFRYKPLNSGNWSTTSYTPNNFLNIGNLAPNTQYEFQARAWCGGTYTSWSPSKYFNTCQSGSGICSNPYIAYCGNTYYGNNGTGVNNYNTYSGNGVNFTQMYGPEVFYQITLNQSGPLNLSLTGLTYPQDLDLILLSSCNSNSIVAYSGNADNASEYINLSFLPAGTYKIVIDGWNYAVSNYVLTVQCNSTNCSAPATNQLFATNITSNTARINCNYPGATFFDWRYRVAGSGLWNELNANNFNFADLSFLNPNTTYEFQCSVYCNGAWTNWSSSQYFTTTGFYSSNDEPCGAVELVAGNSCYPVSGSNTTASTSWYPAPPTECNTGGMRDVWYKVQVPYTGKVKISTFAGSMYDAVVAFYYGGCNSLSAGNPTCFDITNGDEMPDVTITSAPGTYWYIRIWGYGGSTGTFSICAQTMFSLVEGDFTVSDTEGSGDRSDEIVNKDKKVAAAPMVSSLQLFPVPAQDELNVSATLAAESDVTIKILNMAGQLVLEETLSQSPVGDLETRLDVSSLPSGTYLLRFQADGQETTSKFVKM
ncbi:MAG: T9SS type A sorting domain-containing protein [Saprospiraceae bacterium]